MRNFAGQQLAIKQDEVFQRQLVGEFGRRGEGHFHFQPAFALIGLELFRSGISELRRGNEVGRNFLQLKIHCGPRLRHCRRPHGRGDDRAN